MVQQFAQQHIEKGTEALPAWPGSSGIHLAGSELLQGQVMFYVRSLGAPRRRDASVQKFFTQWCIFSFLIKHVACPYESYLVCHSFSNVKPRKYPCRTAFETQLQQCLYVDFPFCFQHTQIENSVRLNQFFECIHKFRGSAVWGKLHTVKFLLFAAICMHWSFSGFMMIWFFIQKKTDVGSYSSLMKHVAHSFMSCYLDSWGEGVD